MSVSDRGIFTLAFQDKLFEVIFIDPQRMATEQANLSGGVITHSQSTIHLHDVACFIYEPLLQGAGGMKMYEAKELDEFINACHQHDIICIADEVMTGFGRTGKLFASEYMEQKPDIVCLSKGLTGGTMALGVTAANKKIHDAFVSDNRLKTFFHGHSYTANPIACAAALASLDLLQKESCLENIRRIARQHHAFLQKLRSKETSSDARVHTRNHRQLGTIVAFEIESGGNDNYLNTIGATVTKMALSSGVFLRPLGNTVYIMPPYCITELQLQKVYDTLMDIMDNL
jgi:adenosylmethionine-8-amino-7-oxononanoate aminotransferase